MRLEGLVDVVQQLDVTGVIQVIHLKQLLTSGNTILGQRCRTRFFIDAKVSICREPRDQAVDLIVEIGRFFRRTRND